MLATVLEGMRGEDGREGMTDVMGMEACLSVSMKAVWGGTGTLREEGVVERGPEWEVEVEVERGEGVGLGVGICCSS